MTAREFLTQQIEDAHFALKKVLRDFPETAIDYRAIPTMKTPRETALHLCECYVAASRVAHGENHAWGSYTTDTADWGRLNDELDHLQQVAYNDFMADHSNERLREASEFLVEHIHYHVGQLCTLRLNAEADWNAYSIYR